MEFRKCPACEASVLDDDAADCPFCGALMSGKPTTKPAKAAPKPTEKSAAGKPTGKGPSSAAAKAPSGPATSGPASAGKQLAKRSAVADRPEADDADPFDVDTSVVAQAPPMAPRPAKGRMIRIVCPMCETPGFISPKMQGRDVKCCNPNCLVPVFKSPRQEKKVEPEPQAAGFFSARNIMLACAIIVPLAAIITFLVLRDTGPEPYQSRDRSSLAVTETDEGTSREETNRAAETNAVKPKMSLAQIQQQSLALSITAAQDPGDNRSKPYCRRLTAEAYAQAGDLKEARNQIARLKGVTKGVTGVSFYVIEPLVEIAWQQLAQSDSAGAEKTLDEAFRAAGDFPPVGRPAAAAAASLAAALAAVDRVDDARLVLRRLGRDDERAISRERVAALVQITMDLEIFDLDRVLRFTSLDVANEPLAVATTVSIAAHQQWDEAIAWALGVPDVASREDCLAALAMVAGRHAAITGDNAPVEAVTQAGKKLSATGQSRVEAGVATGLLMREKRETATAALQRGLALFDSITPPQAMPRSTVKLIHDSADQPNNGLPKGGPRFRSAAAAAAQLARLQHLLDDNEAAWSTLLRAWEFTRGIGPEFTATSTLVDELAKNRAAAEQRLRGEMGITNRDLGDRAFRSYGRQAQIWGAAAAERFELEISLLEEALSWGLLDNVAEVVADPPAVIPSAVGQPYASSALTSTLNARETPRGGETSDRIARLVAQSERLFEQNKYTEAAKLLGDYRGRHFAEHLRDLQGLELACRMLKLNDPDLYFPFILALYDPVLVEDCFEMTAALAVRNEMAIDLWERYRVQGLTATQRVAFFRGLIAGIVAVGGSSPSADTQTAAGPQPGGAKAE